MNLKLIKEKNENEKIEKEKNALKKSSKIYSGVKQYIKGNLNANELSSMRKFTLEKSNNKGYDTL